MLQSPDTDSSLCTSIPFTLTPKEARGVRHEKLVNTNMEPSLDPDDYTYLLFAFDPGDRFLYERIRHASYEEKKYGLDDPRAWHT